MNVFYLFLASSFLFCTNLSAEIKTYKITQELCNRLIIDHKPRADVAYQQEAPGFSKPFVPVDVGNSIKVTPPSDFSIPVRFDLEKYLGVPRKVTTQNHATLSANQTILQSLQKDIQDNIDKAKTSTTAAQESNTDIENRIENSVGTTQELTDKFVETANSLETALTSLQKAPPTFDKTTSILSENLTTLRPQFNPYEKDSHVIDQNITYLGQNRQAIEASDQQVTASTQQLADLEKSLSQAASLLDQSPDDISERENITFNSGETSTLKAKFENLQESLVQAQQDYQSVVGTSPSGIPTTQEKLGTLQDQFRPLDDPKHKFVEFANLGEIKVKGDGRLYFNNQPLFNDDIERLRKACAKLATN